MCIAAHLVCAGTPLLRNVTRHIYLFTRISQNNEGLKTYCGKINHYAMNVYGELQLWVDIC